MANEYLEMVVAGQGKATPTGQDIVAGQGKGTGNNVVYQAVPITTVPKVEKKLLQATPVVAKRDKGILLKASANPFTQYQQYNTVKFFVM